MRKNDSVIKKLTTLKEDKTLIAGHYIKDIVPRSYFQNEDSSIGAVKEMYCTFEEFILKFTQDEFIHGNDDNLHVEIFIESLSGSNAQDVTNEAQKVFTALKAEYLQDELEAVEPTIVS
jgi:hypothetical protein